MEHLQHIVVHNLPVDTKSEKKIIIKNQAKMLDFIFVHGNVLVGYHFDNAQITE